MQTHILPILAFGIARDIVGAAVLHWNCHLPLTSGDLKAQLVSKYPRFASLGSLRIAVNSTYVTDDVLINNGDEIALIPPVSGG